MRSKPSSSRPAALRRRVSAAAAALTFSALLAAAPLRGIVVSTPSIAAAPAHEARETMEPSERCASKAVQTAAAASLEQINLLAHKARLEAELDDRDEIRFSPALTERGGERAIERIMRDEKMTLETRSRSFHSAVDEIERSKRVALNEIEFAEAKHEIIDQHIALLQQALDIQKGLLAKGQSLAVDRLNLAQRIVDYRLMMTDLELTAARSREDVARAERNLVDVRSQRRHEILPDLDETQARLADQQDRDAAASAAANDAGHCAAIN
jgi:hypothetical protein